MKLTPVASPHDIKQVRPSDGTAAKAKAVAAWEANQTPVPAQAQAQAQEHPVVNPSQVAPEEMTAIKPTQVEPIQAQDTSTPTEETKEIKAPVLSSDFIKLARQEKLLRQKAVQQEQASKTRQSELDAREAAIQARENEYKQGWIKQDRFAQDPLSVLEETGVNWDDLTQQMLNRQPTDPRVMSTITKLEAKIAQLESEQKTSKVAQEEQQRQAYQSAVKQITSDAKALVANDPSFEMIKATGSVKDVVELITRTHAEEGIVMSVEDAAQQVEDYLADEAFKLSRLGKIQKRVQQAAQPKVPPQQTPAQKQTQPGTMKTLTNAASSTRKMSSKERAILAFEGKLNG